MNALTKVNTALSMRRMMPLDGSCECDHCGASSLTRNQVKAIGHNIVCHNCFPLYVSDRVICKHCNDTGFVLDRMDSYGRMARVSCRDCGHASDEEYSFSASAGDEYLDKLMAGGASYEDVMGAAQPDAEALS